MTQPGIEPWSSGPLTNTLLIWSMAKNKRKSKDIQILGLRQKTEKTMEHEGDWSSNLQYGVAVKEVSPYPKGSLLHCVVFLRGFFHTVILISSIPI